MAVNLDEIAGLFLLDRPLSDGGLIGSGHINDTYAARLASGERVVFQRINHQVFGDVPGLMSNICRVVEHVSNKLREQGVADLQRRVLQVMRNADGQPWVMDASGNYWRAFPMIEGVVTYDQLETTQQAFLAAKAFGHFGAMLADLPEPALVATIPHFHDGQRRLETFRVALVQDSFKRAASAAKEIAWLEQHAYMFDVLPDLLAAGQLPLRVTHNDTKINNVLFDTVSGEAVCVIDLDTVMPGSLLYDFGDMVRTSVGSVAEDEPDLSKLFLREGIFEALLRGYLVGVGSAMTVVERDHLVFSGQLMCLLIGLRFLTDYLMGDTYFRVRRPMHNLERCKVQFSLARLLIAERASMEARVDEIRVSLEA